MKHKKKRERISVYLWNVTDKINKAMKSLLFLLLDRRISRKTS